MDEILVAYRRGERFPQELYNRASKLGVFDSQTKNFMSGVKIISALTCRCSTMISRDAMNGSSHIELSTNVDETSDEKTLRRALADTNLDFSYDGLAEQNGVLSYSTIRSTAKLERVNEDYIKVVTSQNIVGLSGETSNRLVIQQNKINEMIAWLMDIQEFRLWQPHFIHEVIRPVNQIKYDRISGSYSVVWMKLTEAELKIAPFRSMTRAEISTQADTEIRRVLFGKKVKWLQRKVQARIQRRQLLGYFRFIHLRRFHGKTLMPVWNRCSTKYRTYILEGGSKLISQKY